MILRRTLSFSSLSRILAWWLRSQEMYNHPVRGSVAAVDAFVYSHDIDHKMSVVNVFHDSEFLHLFPGVVL